jgi:hypothetical protein
MDLQSLNCEGPMTPRMRTLTQRLQERKERAEEELRQVQMAQDILARNPEVESLLNILSRIG